MKVLVDNYNDKNFTYQVMCRQVKDENGFVYGDPEDFCGSTLEIEGRDVKKHFWGKGIYDRITGVSYVVVCPLCGSWIELPEAILPGSVKNKAEKIYRSR